MSVERYTITRPAGPVAVSRDGTFYVAGEPIHFPPPGTHCMCLQLGDGGPIETKARVATVVREEVSEIGPGVVIQVVTDQDENMSFWPNNLFVPVKIKRVYVEQAVWKMSGVALPVGPHRVALDIYQEPVRRDGFLSVYRVSRALPDGKKMPIAFSAAEKRTQAIQLAAVETGVPYRDCRGSIEQGVAAARPCVYALVD